MNLQSIYSRSPVWAQHAAVTAYGLYWYRLRFGGGYRRAVEEYRLRSGFGAEEWQRFTDRALKELLPCCARHVPYYRDTWSAEAKEAALAGFLGGIPMLEKQALRAEPEAFLRQDMTPRSPKTFHTSGSTGTPIDTMWTIEEVRRSRAVREVRSNNWAGVSYSMPRATFSGRMVVPEPNSSGPFHRFNYIERQVYFSAFHLSPDTAARYVSALRKHKVQWLSGYAVSFYLLAKSILDRGLEVPPLRGVITTSEKVTLEMREVMEAAYGCAVYEEYSTLENVMLATQCCAGRLHVSPDVGVVEIVNPDGTPCRPGEPGEVIATGLMRRWQPLIRYRLGDVAAWDDVRCDCGSAMPILKEVVGRLEDVVVGPDGRELVRFHGLFVHQPHVREGQVIQETLDRMRIRVVPTAGFGAADVADLTERVRSRMGPEVHVAVETVASIPRTTAGKFRAVISHVSAQRAQSSIASAKTLLDAGDG